MQASDVAVQCFYTWLDLSGEKTTYADFFRRLRAWGANLLLKDEYRHDTTTHGDSTALMLELLEHAARLDDRVLTTTCSLPAETYNEQYVGERVERVEGGEAPSLRPVASIEFAYGCNRDVLEAARTGLVAVYRSQTATDGPGYTLEYFRRLTIAFALLCAELVLDSKERNAEAETVKTKVSLFVRNWSHGSSLNNEGIYGTRQGHGGNEVFARDLRMRTLAADPLWVKVGNAMNEVQLDATQPHKADKADQADQADKADKANKAEAAAMMDQLNRFGPDLLRVPSILTSAVQAYPMMRNNLMGHFQERERKLGVHTKMETVVDENGRMSVPALDVVTLMVLNAIPTKRLQAFTTSYFVIGDVDERHQLYDSLVKAAPDLAAVWPLDYLEEEPMVAHVQANASEWRRLYKRLSELQKGGRDGPPPSELTMLGLNTPGPRMTREHIQMLKKRVFHEAVKASPELLKDQWPEGYDMDGRNTLDTLTNVLPKDQAHRTTVLRNLVDKLVKDKKLAVKDLVDELADVLTQPWQQTAKSRPADASAAAAAAAA